MKIQADFSAISHEFVPIPPGDVVCVVDQVEEGTKNDKPQVHIVSKVKDPSKPELEGREVHEFLVLTTNDGKPNKIALGRIKAYAIAILGEEAANSKEGIDPMDLKGGTVGLTLEEGTYTKTTDTGEKVTKKNTEVAKVWKVT